MDRICLISSVAFGLILSTGCSSVQTQDRNGLVSYSNSGEPQEELPLLPRRTAKESWASRNQPLPPLPPSVATIASSNVVTDVVPSAPEVIPPPPSSPPPGPPAMVSAPPTSPPPTSPPMVTAPPVSTVSDISIPQISNDQLEDLVRAHRGKILFVNCWGIDCGPCVEELPHLNEIHENHGREGLHVVAINTDVEDRYDEVKEFVQKNRFGFDVYVRAPGPDTKFRRAIDPEYAADPYTLIFDKEGNRVASIADALPADDWKKVADAVLNGRQIHITDPEIVRLY